MSSDRLQNTPFSAMLAERLVNDRELAQVLSVSRRHVHSLRARGLLRGIKLGGALRFGLRESLERVLGNADGGEKGGRT